MLEKSSVIAMYNRFFLVYKKIMMQHLIFDHSRHNILICGKSVPPHSLSVIMGVWVQSMKIKACEISHLLRTP